MARCHMIKCESGIPGKMFLFPVLTGVALLLLDLASGQAVGRVVSERYNNEAYNVYSRAPSAEPSPEGHWTKNFAALSVHRRKDWVVTVKGFNRFVWDFESSTKKANPENAHGIFASHGSMLIANSEEALEAHDVNNGWDWTKTPGATTMSLTLLQTRLKKARNLVPFRLLEELHTKGQSLKSVEYLAWTSINQITSSLTKTIPIQILSSILRNLSSFFKMC
ncbi:hypothetical protein OS493_014331 [Desmophyllum pertusum]|uniref:Polysaccharide lyase family 8 central domain-containing protein n=1 Tax=Desmophyllum pertusum TaxID=174260 RepID=A0A9X0CT35_9CNID|nr:hypothetical protein OS493_014331 [Desmophyllum pertusum]